VNLSVSTISLPSDVYRGGFSHIWVNKKRIAVKPAPTVSDLKLSCTGVDLDAIAIKIKSISVVAFLPRKVADYNAHKLN